MTIVLKKEPSLEAKHSAFVYQLEAVDAVKDLDYGGIFHEQGLGKTKIAIDLILYWLEKKIIDSVIVVTKKTLVKNWEREFEVHTKMAPRVITNSKKENYYVFNSPSRLYLTHYEVFKKEKKRLKLFQKARKIGVILDESQKIKNPDSELTKVYLDLAPGFTRRIIMTGTPIANRPYDIWAQVNFLDQGVSLGKKFDVFKANLDITNELGDNEDKQKIFKEALENIYISISEFTVRETKNGGRISLPEKKIIFHTAEWEEQQYELYKRIQNDLETLIIKDGMPRLDNIEDILKKLLRLVQVASNPALITESYQRHPGKFRVLEDIVFDITDRKEKAIIWTSFVDNVLWLKQEFIQFNPAIIYGRMNTDDRDRNVQKFINKKDTKLMIATPSSAKEGLTLTVANHVIFYDRSFSLDDYLQSQDRIHRISQKKICYIHNIIMKDSIDNWVHELLKAKEVAAKYAQGDISSDKFIESMTYDYGHMLKEILGVNKDG